jgi:[ribosomal protein S5]-alanine N-acetyltransferase
MLTHVIATDRVVLRPWKAEDAPHVVEYANDREWGRYLPVPFPYSLQDAEQFIASQMLLDHTAAFAWAIEHEGRPVGGVNLHLEWNGRIAEIDYAVARRLWGRGLATEVARALLDAAFGSGPIVNRVRASADPRNAASTRVLQKVGMKFEGCLRSNRYERDESVDEAWYGILPSEWLSTRSTRG